MPVSWKCMCSLTCGDTSTKECEFPSSSIDSGRCCVQMFWEGLRSSLQMCLSAGALSGSGWLLCSGDCCRGLAEKLAAGASRLQRFQTLNNLCICISSLWVQQDCVCACGCSCCQSCLFRSHEEATAAAGAGRRALCFFPPQAASAKVMVNFQQMCEGSVWPCEMAMHKKMRGGEAAGVVRSRFDSGFCWALIHWKKKPRYSLILKTSLRPCELYKLFL